MAFRFRSLLLWFACASCLPTAHGAERVGDATYLYDLGQYSQTATELEREFLSSIETASGQERFNQYWTYNHLTGARVQLDFLQSLLELAVAISPSSDDENARTTLRDHAQFVILELDNAVIELGRNVPELSRPAHLRSNELLRSLLSAVRTTVSRLLIDQCARIPCPAGS